MKNLRNTYSVVLVGSLVISQLSGYTVSAASTASGVSVYPSPAISAVTASATSKLGSIKLGSNFQATLEDVNIWPQAGGNILTYTLNYTNGSNSNENLLHYFSRVITPTGSVIPGNPITGDVLKKKVISKGNLRVTYYVNIGTTNSLKGLKIPMYVWDAKVKGYLRQVGSFKLPTNYSPTVAIGKSLNTTMNDLPVTSYTESLQIYEYSGKVYAKVGVSLTNKGDKILEDPGYMVYLVSAGGTSFEMVLDSAQASYKIQPQEKKIVYYITEIPAYLNTNNMKLQFVQKDETLKLALPKSSYNLPAATNPDLIVEKDVVKKIMINNNMIETQLNNATVYEENKKGMWSFQLRLRNTGNKAVKMPSYDLAVKSPIGKAFPVNAKDLNGLVINPLEEKIIQFEVQVPLEVQQDTLQLQMVEAVSTVDSQSSTAENKAVIVKPVLPIAYYNIPYNLRTNTLTGYEYHATNSYGSFVYNLLSLQRFPWMEDDIVVAKLRIINTQSVTLSLPEMKGALKIDYDDLKASTEIFMDKQSVVLAPGKSVDVNVLAKIPYTTDFNHMQVSLYSVADEQTVPFLTLSTNSTMDAINTIDHGGIFRITDQGKNATIQEKMTVVHHGVSSNIVSTELLISNEERRQSKMVRLHAYYKTTNGEFYEATSNQPEAALSPGGKQLITFSSKLPKSVNTSDLSLYMGSGITGNKLSEPGQEATGFINIASLALNSYTPSTNLAQVTLYPYTLSIHSSNGRLQEGSDSIKIDVNYNLFRDGSYDTGTSNHKLMLKMTDPYGQSQEKALALGTDLTEGHNNTISLSFSNDRYKSLNGGTYRLTLYDEIQGERIELASQEYSLTYEELPEMEK
ncbi:hypothetical protein [Paenibacillus crassostreae]|uniref:Uncharacterized protein n=1 Tax=Paenibacillus crassostreae TaxID=1763538 RepID=A0A167F908_9BACL|nr:hypothetical protein [Paenibacillus crassostreae]AOZ90918.1 hypothetical protein LPB68_00990 [Paenibacillus crassostreae]OAB76315.1 hypothetical protein PNBC_02535 [Paenibacillus crassostreae]